MADYLIPLLLIFLTAYGLRKQVNVYSLLFDGAQQGLKLLLTVVPTLILLLSALQMLRVSGAADRLAELLSPLFSLLGIPPETVLLVLVRPISGSAALAVGAELMKAHGTDSLIGRTAAVMLGSTETTFYTISLYFGANGISKTRYALPAALIADFTGFFMASLTARLFWS